MAFSAPCRPLFYSKPRLRMFTLSLFRLYVYIVFIWYQIFYVYMRNAINIKDTNVKISEVLS